MVFILLPPGRALIQNRAPIYFVLRQYNVQNKALVFSFEKGKIAETEKLTDIQWKFL